MPGGQMPGGQMPGGQTPGGQMHSIWQRPARSGRGPVPEHSTAGIARAAVALADADGLAGVTMRAVAAAVGTGPASLYRYVNTRDELLQLMTDRVLGEEFTAGPVSSDPVADLLALGRQTLEMFRRHPWMLEISPVTGLPGPSALGYMEYVLSILSGTDLRGPAKLELFALYNGMIRSFAQLEAEQQRAGQDIAAWQAQVASYLLEVVATGRYPHLAAAMASPPAAGDPSPAEPIFDRALTRVLSGLLQRG
jgi:AcrR family transcriptional regulator